MKKDNFSLPFMYWHMRLTTLGSCKQKMQYFTLLGNFSPFALERLFKPVLISLAVFIHLVFFNTLRLVQFVL
jgi:hypothetical protein